MKKILYTLIIVPFLGFAQNENPCYSINDIFIQMDGENPSLEVNLVAGWNMIGYPCTQDMLLTDGFSSVDDKISLVKNNNGAVYLPEFNFNGIGFLESGQGYQVKMNEFVMDFSFCESVQYPNLEGCTDCEAANFNQWANVDDGSCNYDSDGDGVPDSEEVVGCQDSTACDYNINATDIGECFYAQDGYDCEGNLLIYVGAEAHGGIVFYYDSIGDYGLVAASEDIGDYVWGCVDVMVEGADEQGIGYGLQNTNDIVAACTDTTIAASAALTYESNGYSDWFLPSQDELAELYLNLVQDSININSFNFSNNWYWSSFYESYEFGSGYPIMIGFHYYQYNLNIEPSNVTDFNKVRPIRAFGNWIMGCMDSLACNYNPEANMADGSCEYAELGYDCEGNITAEIGDIIEGGYLFYLDDSGTRGLVAAMEDIGQSNWLNSINAAELATLEGYDDWYLPSIEELELMYNTIGLDNSGNFLSDVYWSSTVNGDASAWFVDFNDGITYSNSQSNARWARPIRAFGYTLGCMDSLACNYNPEANMYDGSCEYAELGYDCEGNELTQVGDLAEGGIVFYLDETGEHGLVAAMEDLTEGATDPYGYGFNGYEWGCYLEYVGADGQAIGTGYQNTMDIVNQGCVTENVGISPAQAALDAEINGYSDWYLPSIDELNEMYSTIGIGGPDGDIGGFENKMYWSSSEQNYNSAWTFSFNGGNYPDDYQSKASSLGVRVIRAFGYTLGCMDSLACNYNPEANMADGSCEYAELGYDCEGDSLDLYIGQEAYGGIVFYVDETGQHGLVAAMEDLGEYEWGCIQTGPPELSGADGTSIGTGYQNTLDIVSGCSEIPIAASEALAYESEGYSDWYLPSKDELIEMYSTIGQGATYGNIGGFENYRYWSSSEYNYYDAWNVSFVNGNAFSYFNKASSLGVRVIRAFGYALLGCMDSLACNFNPEANMADGSCEYPDLGYDCEGDSLDLYIGQEAYGGIVFYVDETGQHGLVAAMEDLGEYEWGCSQTGLSGADGTSIGTGYQNTLDIVSGCSETPIAASEALAYESEGYSDWYLPSKDELSEMYNTIGNGGPEGNIGGFYNYLYWSSSENYSYNAWYVEFTDGDTYGYFKYDAFRVRVIRAF